MCLKQFLKNMQKMNKAGFRESIRFDGGGEREEITHLILLGTEVVDYCAP